MRSAPNIIICFNDMNDVYPLLYACAGVQRHLHNLCSIYTGNITGIYSILHIAIKAVRLSAHHMSL